MTDKTKTDIIDEIDADKEAENLEVALNRIALQKNLAKEGDAILNEIIKTKDSNQLEDLTKLFELNKKKKSIARQNRLSNLLVKLDDEVERRLDNNPYMLEDQYLAKYISIMQEAADKPIEDIPLVQINNQKNEININSVELNRESRAKVLEAVNSILASSTKKTIIEEETDND